MNLKGCEAEIFLLKEDGTNIELKKWAHYDFDIMSGDCIKVKDEMYTIKNVMYQIEENDEYSFVDAIFLEVGEWQRI